MRTILAAALALLFLSAHAYAAETQVSGRHAAREVAAIRQTIEHAAQGWVEGDAARAASEYADDAYFLNAFGRERSGRAAIRQFLEQLFASPGFRAGRGGPLNIVSIRFVHPRVALVHVFGETRGQLQADGSQLGARRTHVFRLMRRRGGVWRTDSYIVSDERSGGSLAPEPAASSSQQPR